MSELMKILIKIIAIIFLSLLLFFALQWRADYLSKNETPKSEVTEPVNEDSTFPDAVVATHNYSEGVHSLEGVIDLPTPCYSLTTDVVKKGEKDDEVVLQIQTTNDSESNYCTQVIDSRAFKVEFTSSLNPIITATYNGQWIPLVVNDKSGLLLPRSED